MSGVWDKERTADLITMWNEGLSASEIGAALTRKYHFPFTRNSVIGRAHRVHLAARQSPILSEAQPKPAKVIRIREPKPVQVRRVQTRKPVAPAPTPIPSPIPEEPTPVVIDETAGMSLEEVQNVNGCRWPFGDRKERARRFCGAPQHQDHAYCEHHKKISINRTAFGSKVTLRALA
jgi:GcrA cell cycle regulator